MDQEREDYDDRVPVPFWMRRNVVEPAVGAVILLVVFIGCLAAAVGRFLQPD